ncbi:glycine betaine ABC transporter substrate-binding protein [Raoultibacter phocaeensis]|uniref:glycine betaine ABC transporter substrate-binding protein n=1 Tax=Raoultibacter phocaeensis TaxID=2479841 RepID=UPI001117F6EE|nr:glycine betaine ABC transporter substrate-binding protein [Raoultibacter phocaeensis]
MGEQIAQYLSTNGAELQQAFLQHVEISALAFLIAVIIGVPSGYLCWRFKSAGKPLLAFFQVLRVIPSIAILLLFIPIMGTGVIPASIALVLLAVPAILMNTTAGLGEVDPAVVETGYGLGMTDRQVLFKVRFPLALPLILAGMKTAAIEIIASATLAAKIGAGGLGELIFTGLGLNRMGLVLVGGLSVALISLAVSLLFDLLEYVLVAHRHARAKEGTKMKPIKTIAACLAAVGLAVTLVACGNATAGSNENGKDTIRVGSKDFTENIVVSEVYALALEDAGYTVERVPAVASSVIHTTITSNEIDLYPEYTGTGLLSVLGMDMVTDPDEVYRIVKDEYDKQFDITWLEYAQANDGQGLVIRTSVANEYGIKTISDLQKHASDLNFASQGEFDQREDGLPALIATYGPFDWKSSKVYDNGLKYSVLSNGEGDVSPAYTTEGQLTNTDEYTLLVDDKQVWPPYNLAPIVRNEVLNANPDIADILNKVSATLDTETVTALNAAVDVDKREYDEVAREYYDSIK